MQKYNLRIYYLLKYLFVWPLTCCFCWLHDCILRWWCEYSR